MLELALMASYREAKLCYEGGPTRLREMIRCYNAAIELNKEEELEAGEEDEKDAK